MPRSGVRKVNWPETRAKYKKRLNSFPDNHWEMLNNAYLGTFEVYSTVENIAENDHMDCFAGVILRLAREKGYSPIGVTSERKSNGVYICSNLLNDELREDCKVVYVGKYSYFSQHPKSIWAPISQDYVYEA